jgi:uncharacterized protein YdiU (UPF0061 family)
LARFGLGDGLYDEVAAARFPVHELRFANRRWAERIGLGSLDAAEWESCFARFEPLPDNLGKPLALRYHGHQFDVYNPHLGDGRGFLYAQLLDDRGRLLDLGTKGSGTTPWSRGGDGRLTLKGGVREVLATEMLESLGVETSKSLSLYETGESLSRSDEPSPTRSSVLVRLSHSHVRFGTFQRLAYAGDRASMQKLLGYCVESFFPTLGDADVPARFLEEVARRSAALVASWMVAGFVHGVLNSDNMNVTGESFDYGPYRFLPTYDLGFTAAYFDEVGLYAYGNQPAAVLRNLVRLGGALRTIEPALAIGGALACFEPTLVAETARRVVARLGLEPNGDTDDALVSAVLELLDASGIGFDRFFFDLRGGRAPRGPDVERYAGPRWDALRALLETYTPAKDAHSPYYEGDAPCTLLIDEIEAIWSAIAERDDWSLFDAKITAIRSIR